MAPVCGQLGGLFKVYSGCRSSCQNLLGSIFLSPLLRLWVAAVGLGRGFSAESRVWPFGVVEVDPLADDAPGLEAVGKVVQIMRWTLRHPRTDSSRIWRTRWVGPHSSYCSAEPQARTHLEHSVLLMRRVNRSSGPRNLKGLHLMMRHAAVLRFWLENSSVDWTTRPTRGTEFYEATGLGRHGHIEVVALTLDSQTWEVTDEYDTLIDPERDVGPVGLYGI